MYATFGEFLRAKRLEKRITLRAFSQSLGYDPANYSRMERGLAPPPASEDRLRAMAERLGIAPNSEEYRELVRLAALRRGEIPRRVLADPEVVAKLPVLFRTLEGDKVDDALMEELCEALKRA